MDDSRNVSPKLQSLVSLIRSPVQLQEAIQQLQNLSLVRYELNIDSPALRIHDLIQFMVQESAKKEGTQQDCFKSAVMLTCSAFRRVGDTRSYKSWAVCERFIPHLQSLTVWDKLHSGGDDNEEWRCTPRAKEQHRLYIGQSRRSLHYLSITIIPDFLFTAPYKALIALGGSMNSLQCPTYNGPMTHGTRTQIGTEKKQKKQEGDVIP